MKKLLTLVAYLLLCHQAAAQDVCGEGLPKSCVMDDSGQLTANPVLGQDLGTQGSSIKMYGATGQFFLLKPSAVAGNVTGTLPPTAGVFVNVASTPLVNTAGTLSLNISTPLANTAGALSLNIGTGLANSGGNLVASNVPFSVLSGQATLAQLPSIANGTVLGSVTAGTNPPVALTSTQLTSLCNTVTASLSGCVPAIPNNTTTFFRGDGSYAAPPSSSVTGILQVQSFCASGCASNVLSGTYTPNAGATSLWVRMAGGGGGGGAAGTNSGANGTASSFGSWTAAFGAGGSAGAGVGGAGGSGGTNGTGSLIVRLSGGRGSNPIATGANVGGSGGNTPFFGGGAPISPAPLSGANGIASTGGGGAGGAQSGTGDGGGGGSGEYVEFIVPSPASVSYSVGSGGNGGAAGVQAGGNAGGGILIVVEMH